MDILELFSDTDISGRKLYGFQTPVKKNSMMIKANQCRTPETPKCLRTLPTLKIVLDNIIRNEENEKFHDPDMHKNIDAKSIKYFNE